MADALVTEISGNSRAIARTFAISLTSPEAEPL